MKDEGRIAPALDIPTVAKAFIVVCDGMFWRRAVDPGFDAQGRHAGRAAAHPHAPQSGGEPDPVSGPAPTQASLNNNQTTQ